MFLNVILLFRRSTNYNSHMNHNKDDKKSEYINSSVLGPSLYSSLHASYSYQIHDIGPHRSLKIRKSVSSRRKCGQNKHPTNASSFDAFFACADSRLLHRDLPLPDLYNQYYQQTKFSEHAHVKPDQWTSFFPFRPILYLPSL